MTKECITPLRRRMIEDMTVRHLASETQRNYIRAVKTLASFLGRSPDTATAEDLRLFQLRLNATHVRPPTINNTVTALRFFFSVTLNRADATRHLTFVHEPRKLPVVLSPEEVARLLEASPGVKYKAALSVAYGAGLRVSEVGLGYRQHGVMSGRCPLSRVTGTSVAPSQCACRMIIIWSRR